MQRRAAEGVEPRMWGWLRLDWGKALLLAGLLLLSSTAAQRYAHDTITAVQSPTVSTLGGLQAWQVRVLPDRRDGLLAHRTARSARVLRHWQALGNRPSVWVPRFGAFVRQPGDRQARSVGVWVVEGLDFPGGDCALLGGPAVPAGAPLVVNRYSSCTVLASADEVLTTPVLRELKALLQSDSVVVMGPALALRVFGQQWHAEIGSAYLGAGPAQVESAPAVQPLAELEPLRAAGWKTEAITHEKSVAEILAERNRDRWKWAMACLGGVVGMLAALGYRRVLSLTVAVRRTGAAPASQSWLDAWKLSVELTLFTAVVCGAGLAMQQLCGGTCAAKAMPWWSWAKAALDWTLWPLLGFALGLLVANLAVVQLARRTRLQSLFARAAAG